MPLPSGDNVTLRTLAAAFLLTALGGVALYVLADYLKRYAERKEREIEEELKELEESGDVF
ncbi:hypothetical protein [Thermococcus sp. AM4]|uniref:hypothetical protein n=1 Tax=Thermococcus sp. (strain AM4) TaxID=246969 RepID=UPI0001870F6E|nr:hypothetical protein [Thermococcus sp. AM4]EEB73686.1 hypothetical protein TAM4_1435 [Thermococcus sp. AM4]